VAPVAEHGRGEQALWGAGVQWFTAHDQPGPFGPVRQVDQVGELGHRRSGPFVAVLASRRPPGVVVPGDAADGRVNAGVGAGHRREADVAGPGLPHELGAPGGVDPHLHAPAHHGRGVAGAMPHGDLPGQLADGLVQDGDVVGDVVRAGVARP